MTRLLTKQEVKKTSVINDEKIKNQALNFKEIVGERHNGTANRKKDFAEVNGNE